MAIYKVQSDGKAQKGLKAGDKVVTGGGTYQITGVNSDGSYKSTLVDKNQTTSNYTGSYANSGSSGGSSGGGGSSKGSSSYSQYTAPTLGNTWDANTDYQAIINNAVANGDYVTAAKAEQLRNQKITAQGLGYDLTNNYKGWLNTRDYSTEMYEGMANGISAQEMQALYNGRYNKADGTIGLDQYKNDNLMQIAQNYINQQLALEQQQAMLDQWEADNPKEEYQGKYDPQIDALLSQILNRDDFSYNAMNDPLYQQYAAMYQREGDRAMKETLAEAAAGAGGMNTYAITAAQQANNYYNSQLNDRIPELYQLAYEKYLKNIDMQVRDLGLLQSMDETQYNRYRNTMNDWQNDKTFAYGMYNDAVNQGNWQTTHDYNSMWDNINYLTNNSRYNQEWNANQSQLDLENSRYDTEKAEKQLLAVIESGVMPNDELITKAGWDKATVEQLVQAAIAEKNKSTSKSSGGGRSGSGGSGDDEKTIWTSKDNTTTVDLSDFDESKIPATMIHLDNLETGSERYSQALSICNEILAKSGKSEVLKMLKEWREAGDIDQTTYTVLHNKFRG